MVAVFAGSIFDFNSQFLAELHQAKVPRLVAVGDAAR